MVLWRIKANLGWRQRSEIKQEGEMQLDLEDSRDFGPILWVMGSH